MITLIITLNSIQQNQVAGQLPPETIWGAGIETSQTNLERQFRKTKEEKGQPVY